MTLLKLWIYKSHNQLNSIGQEIELLEGMKQVKQDLSAGAVASGTSRPPIKPFVITKDMLKVRMTHHWYTRGSIQYLGSNTIILKEVFCHINIYCV